jgi:DNA damage-binding protein 1
MKRFFCFSSGQSNEEERKCLQSHACVHIGEQINVFRHGSLGMQQSNELFTQNFQSMVIAGTVSGSIVLFAQLSNNMYKILSELQRRLVQFITTAGR